MGTVLCQNYSRMAWVLTMKHSTEFQIVVLGLKLTQVFVSSVRKFGLETHASFHVIGRKFELETHLSFNAVSESLGMKLISAFMRKFQTSARKFGRAAPRREDMKQQKEFSKKLHVLQAQTPS
jgi:hypothetical protein